ncbi:MAG: cytidylate kinase-like family protein [Clostridiales bacterium]|nr:cytidylate kinase-like family protein [Clostridiales bacterium]MDD6873739.1 cytidylate kinase-like family protein [Clostridiales bacterium]MDD7367019.1 cytidylate kinase-like family protein [Clostridiales bacterium]MDY2873135.1 cytidylate kinase-like family protein [Eubacteriales bacterium]
MRKIITIGREFGSGGRELGRRLSEHLGIAYYDQEIIAEIAKRTALSEAYVRQITENRPLTSFPIHFGGRFCALPDPLLQQSISIYSEQHRLLCELAEKSDCIIVGRCADYVLRDSHPFRIFVYADAQSKLMRCMERRTPEETLSEQDMKRKITEIDRNRARYYAFFSGQKWGARENYDLLVNTSGQSVKKQAAALYEYLRKMAD